jgi:hypothetical protein
VYHRCCGSVSREQCGMATSVHLQYVDTTAKIAMWAKAVGVVVAVVAVSAWRISIQLSCN